MRRSSPALPLVLCSPHGELSLDLFSDLRHAVERDRTGLFVAEGARFLISALDNGADVRAVVLSPSLLSDPLRGVLFDRVKRERIPLLNVSRRCFEEISSSSEPSGVLLAVRQNWRPLPMELSCTDLWLGIENLRTSGNFGTLLRSATATGATGVMIFGPARDRTDPYDPVAVRASMGAIFGLEIVGTSHREFRRWSVRSELRVFGATGDAETDYREANYLGPSLLMLGNERDGLSEPQRLTSDALVRIPMASGTDSLNVAMAGTVLLYEAFGQRHPTVAGRDLGRRQKPPVPYHNPTL